MTNQTFKTITSSQIKSIRETLLQKQNYQCAICGESFEHMKPSTTEGTAHNETKIHPSDVGCLDHQHLFKSEELGYKGGGLIRGVLCRNCNSLEGKFWNAAHRFGMSDPSEPVESRKLWLQKLLKYYDSNFQHIEPTLHPSENRVKVLNKQHYNKLIKVFRSLETSWNKRTLKLKAMPKFTGRWSPTLEELDKILQSLTEDEFKKLKDFDVSKVSKTSKSSSSAKSSGSAKPK